jgi:antitoxin component YwqK of YwqJK toxin-antitoxin module
MMTVDEYERTFPIKDPENKKLIIHKTLLHTGELHKYTVNNKGILHGIYRIYRNDRLVEETYYKYGMKDGIHMEWDIQNGYLSKICNYKTNMLHGEYTEYDVRDYYGPYTERNMISFISIRCNYFMNRLHGSLTFRNVLTGESLISYYLNGRPCAPTFRDIRD